MENIPAQPIANPQPVPNPVTTSPLPVEPVLDPNPPSPVPPVNSGNKFNKIVFSILILVLLLVVISGALYLYFMQGKKTYNATVYNQPTPIVKAQIKSTPTPPEAQINPNDTSNQALNQDSQTLDQNITNASSDLNNVDQGFSDQQANLQ